MSSSLTFATDPFLNVTVSNSISLDLKPISTTGTFAKSDTTTNTISATTNYFAGYTLGIAASNNDADAANLVQTPGEGNEQTIVGRISSIGMVEGVTSAGITEQAFSNSSNIQYNNTWGYMLTKLNSSESTNYLPAPTTTTATTLDTTNVANPETANNYNIAIGARIDTEIPKGSYTNTFVITAVANPIPYSITYNKNTEDNVTNMPATTSGSTSDASITLPNNKPTRSGYIFAGWCSAIPVASGGIDSCGGNIYYQDGTGSRTFPISQISDNTNNTLYAMWQEVHTITFTAGSNIDTLIIADSSDKWKPYYIATNGTKTFSNVPVGRRYAVTVVPVADHILDNWTSTSGSTNNLANPTLLTTTYTVGTTDETLTAAGSTNNASYITMQSIDLSIKDQNNPDESIYCPTTGINVTDLRDKKSYTVAKFGNYCYMLSNLRLDNTVDDGNGGTVARVLTNVDSDITPNATYTNFTMPTEVWASASQNYHCKAIMKHYNQGGINEYYYNWYAAKANPYECTDPTTSTNVNDTLALGSICPKGWTLPTYGDILPSSLWGDGANSGMLIVSADFLSGRIDSNNTGSWWASITYSGMWPFYLYFSGVSTARNNHNRCYGRSVRCMRSS